MYKPTVEFQRRFECFIKAYYEFLETGRFGNLFPALYHLVTYCVYRTPSMFVKKV